MESATQDWLDGLRAFVAEQRRQRPLATPDDDPAAWSAERSLLGASIAARVADLEAVRGVRRGIAPLDPDPAVVLTTSAAGIAALESLLAAVPDIAAVADGRVVPVTEREYRLWCIGRPDEGFRRHANLWSWVKTRVPRQRWPEFAPFPIREGDAYWLHREGLAGAGELDRRVSHLWRWDGRHASLLKACIDERSLPGLGHRHD